jgi:hypothetical protein
LSLSVGIENAPPTSTFAPACGETLPKPLQEAGPLAVPYGIYDGKRFKPIPPIDVNATSDDECLDIFNRLCTGIGKEVRYCVANAEVEATLPQQGQPYSVYPKKFKRPEGTSVKLADPMQAVRIKGPMIGIQWSVLNSMVGPTNATVPEEIFLL